ncbi:MAG: hypothetical protein J2P31_13290, partial [Blastocatellia bacterium]|nr:hypothetical protein [Blastocatellia bacterium]
TVADESGPRLFTPEMELVMPDLLVWKNGTTFWIEAKTKGHFTWYRQNGTWQTGIDRHHYDDYLQVWRNFDKSWEVWLLFLHETATPSVADQQAGCPPRCPVGLFGNRISFLQNHIDHFGPRWGRHGMVYWRLEDLQLLASLEDIAA